MRLKHVGPLSAALFRAAAGALTGLLIGGFGMPGSLAGVGARGGNPALALGMGAGMLLFAPVFYGFFGFLGGLINAVVYNIVASLSGGIEVEFARD